MATKKQLQETLDWVLETIEPTVEYNLYQSDFQSCEFCGADGDSDEGHKEGCAVLILHKMIDAMYVRQAKEAEKTYVKSEGE